MENCSLLIPAAGRGYLLRLRIGGLTLLDRLGHLARKSGIPRVIILGPRPETEPSGPASLKFVSRYQDWPEDFPGAYIVLKCGYLPDEAFLKSLAESIRGRSTFLIGHCPAAFVVPGSQEGLQRLWEEGGFGRLYEELKASGAEVLAPVSGKIYDVRDAGKIAGTEKQLFRELIKDTEGFMSRHFERKISLALTKRLVRTSITPNQMTVLSILVGLAGAFFLGVSKGFWQVLGSCFFLIHSILDGCDGEIARLKFAESRRGGLLDFWGDNVVHSAVFLAIAWEWSAGGRILFPLGLAAVAVSATWASATLVYWKTMRSGRGGGPLFTSVSSSPEKSRTAQIMDFLSRRDFIYLVVLLAILGHLDWFLYAGAVGTPVFAGVLLGLMIKEKLRADVR
jgi:phosphatidylglycerophosphate synthase